MDAESICRKLQELDDRGADLHELLAQSVVLLHNSEPLFHWTGIYELGDDQVLYLGPFIGAPSDHVSIAVGNGVCGSAVAEGRNKNIPDVKQERNYLACSSETRSELVVLVRSGGRIYAQIDIDSHELDAFDAQREHKVIQVADCLAGFYTAEIRAAQLPARVASAAGPVSAVAMSGAY